MDHDFSRTIIVSTAAFLALLLLSVYLSVVRQRARRRRFLERSIRWHFPAFDCDRPPALPLAVRHGPSGTAGISFSRFSWAEGKVLPTYDYKDPSRLPRFRPNDRLSGACRGQGIEGRGLSR
ncbi:hypothetical protein DFH09DRAFT_1274405 [Mycena vulgaris]|nr:hypothetical protein DFH09DRAFT_1274405 [Mycena vulgaris]